VGDGVGAGAGDSTITIPKSRAEEARAADPSPLAVEGGRLNFNGDFGVVFKVSSKAVAVAYDDLTWEAMSHEVFSMGAFNELTCDSQTVKLQQC
jgi:hypothetical protein